MAVTTSMASSGLAEVLDRILDKGLVIDAWFKVSVLGLELRYHMPIKEELFESEIKRKEVI